MTLRWQLFPILVLAMGLCLPAVADTDWYWHYTPADGPGHGIGLSRPSDHQVSPWQVRLNVGYELDSLGVTVQRQQHLIERTPDWYLASGLGVSHHFLDDNLSNSAMMDCSGGHGFQNGEWAGRLFARWSWGYTMTDARLDLGYGGQLRVREDASNGRWAWSAGPTVDVILGFRL